jgi:hypothetical protein
MAGRRTNWIVLEKIVLDDPFAILFPEFLIHRYKTLTKEDVGKTTLEWWRKTRALAIAEESPWFTDGIRELVQIRSKRAKRRSGKASKKYPHWVDADIVKEILQENPYLLMHPTQMKEEYEKKTGRRFTKGAFNRHLQRNGLRWAMDSPNWTPWLTEEYGRHRSLFRTERPREAELWQILKERHAAQAL